MSDIVIHAAESLVDSVRNDVTQAQSQLRNLIGNDTGKSARTIAGEEVAKIVADAPEAYDTLKEIAEYIASDKEGAAAMAASIAEVKNVLPQKVDKVEGKGLSTEDYTTEDKTKLAGVENGAQVNPLVVPPDASATEGQAADAKATYEALCEANDAANAAIPKYGSVDAAIADGVLTLTPFSHNWLTSDGTAFTVLMGGEAGRLRDCVFVVYAGGTPPTISWGVQDGAQIFNPRTDSATDMEIAPNTTKVFWVTEYEEHQFVVAGWEVPS